MPRGEVLIGGNCVAKGYFTDPANPDPELVEKNKVVDATTLHYFKLRTTLSRLTEYVSSAQAISGKSRKSAH